MMRATIAAALAVAPMLASAQQESCPLILPEGAVVVARPPSGWSPGPKTQVHLSGAGMMSSPPEGMQYLVPRVDKKANGGDRTTFEFQPNDEKWLWCDYGPAAQIAKRIQGAWTSCELTTKRDRHRTFTEVKATCK